MIHNELPAVSDQKLREHYIRLGLILPKGSDWEREVAEYEAARNTPTRRPGSRPHLRIVHAGAGRAR